MPRAVAQYVFAALLALLSVQTALPSRHVASPAQIAWCDEAEQRTVEQIRPTPGNQSIERPVLSYVSRINPQPNAPFLFQRPPPFTSLFA
jgi:hypothetical protein